MRWCCCLDYVKMTRGLESLDLRYHQMMMRKKLSMLSLLIMSCPSCWTSTTTSRSIFVFVIDEYESWCCLGVSSSIFDPELTESPTDDDGVASTTSIMMHFPEAAAVETSGELPIIIPSDICCNCCCSRRSLRSSRRRSSSFNSCCLRRFANILGRT